MDFSFLTNINYIAVITSAIVFFMVGSVWFSTLFGKIWVQELEKHNVTITEPTTGHLTRNMLLTFAGNSIASLAMACFVNITQSTTFASGLTLGLIATLGFAATTLASVFVLENRSLKLFLLDIGYPALGIISSAIILSLWR